MKLLVATDFPPDAPGGGPAVIRQMLKGFPGEVHWWSCRGSVRGSSFLVPGSALRHSEQDSGFGFHVSSFRSCPPGKLMPARKWTRPKAWLMEHVWAPWAVRSLQKTIQQVTPDAIWMIPHDFSIFPLWLVLHQVSAFKSQRSLFRVHATIQDFPDVHGHGKLWGEERVQRMARMQEAIYAQADTRDATSHPMLNELEKRTRAKGIQMLHQGLEPEDFDYLKSLGTKHQERRTKNQEPGTKNEEPRTKNQAPRKIKIAYAGTILVEKEFETFIRLLNQPSTKHQEQGTKNKELGTKNYELGTKNQEQGTKNQEQITTLVELHFFGAHSYADRPWFDSGWMIEHGNLPERELVEALRDCDWGFIPMSLDDEDPRYNRFSFPTKFITYLAAGLPPIVMGHPESSVMKMAERYDVGLRVNGQGGGEGGWFLVPCSSLAERGSEVVIEKADFGGGRLLADAAIRHKMLPGIVGCARQNFDAEAMRRCLWESIGFGENVNQT